MSKRLGKPKPKRTKPPARELEDRLYTDLQLAGLCDGLERQYRFHPTRKFRADFAYPARRLLIEVQGGSWVGGGHTRGAGYERDCERMNLATLEGYQMMWFTSSMVRQGRAVPEIRAALSSDKVGR